MFRCMLVGCCLLAAQALAAFDPVPSAAGAPPSGLTMQVVKYDGSTNGAITVDLKNPTAGPVDFSAEGLYFVPGGDPDHAPQRLGAVGAFINRGRRVEKLTLAPGATERLTFDVYCIDSQRPSPSPGTAFRLSNERMPRELTHDIANNTHEAAKSLGGVHAAPAKSAVQGEVWKTRDRKWTKLQGEGRQEAAKKSE